MSDNTRIDAPRGTAPRQAGSAEGGPGGRDRQATAPNDGPAVASVSYHYTVEWDTSEWGEPSAAE